MRRLRENTMLNTEIGKTGEVTVEGHVIGRLDGFTFAPDAAEAGSDAKALQATALKALAGEIDARAEKLSNAPDDQFVLASDGVIRWTGDAVAKLVAADDILHPRVRIVADERLSGAPREAVQTRLDLWLKTHIEKLLGPLFDLAKAEDVTGIARGIAFQLIEALGVLERQKITAEMKDLDQPSRATLRKYGVRFGAYHIYVPALLKPAARALASLLWAQKHDNVDLSALSGAQHLAGSGRTSFPVDKQLDRDAYRALGYRQCGERAVRVDILERLADLIRPALSWREGSLGDKPAGAFDGRGFVITQAMTSLTGSAGEDFASILRALGYRMDKRPPLPPAPPKPIVIVSEAPADADTSEKGAIQQIIASETPSAEVGAEAASAEVAAVVSEPGVAAETSAIADIASDTLEPVEASAPEPSASPSVTLLPDVAFSTPSEPAVEAEPDPATSVVEAAAVEAPQEPAVTEAAAPDSAASAADVASEASVVTTEAAVATDAAVAAEAAVPEMIEVWRPGGRSEERRPRHDRNRHRNQDRQPAAAQPAPAEGEAAAGEGAKRERHRGRRQRHGDFQAPRRDAPAAATATATPEGAPAREARDDKGRPPRERFQDRGKDRGKDRDKGRDRDKSKFGGPKGGREGRDGGASHRQYATSAPPSRERDRPVDPNSPFAKLAALKEQLAANRKDQR
jgi:ATP-dependent RNA helicase SUPV3L1/SUV3